MNTEKNNFRDKTPIQEIQSCTNNRFFIKRDDLYPLSLGGNKARKGRLFFEEILKEKSDCVVTYGSASSNHCRVISSLAAMNTIPCIIISPSSDSESTSNKTLVQLCGSTYRYCQLEKVSETIAKTLEELRLLGHRPYFIQGGGHGNIGTQAYVEAYNEIYDYETATGIHFDYVFHASGTGTTQAGLICGQRIKAVCEKTIVGISIARRNPYGKQHVVDSVNSYFGRTEVGANQVQFLDQYIGAGYGHVYPEVLATIKRMWLQNGIPLDTVYTGKAFYGAEQYLIQNQIEGKNILFIHTGGTPLFFDDLERIK